MGVERLAIPRKTGNRGILWPGVITAWMIVAAPGWGAASPYADLSLSVVKLLGPGSYVLQRATEIILAIDNDPTIVYLDAFQVGIVFL